jgi:hypothetical protein
MKPVLSVLSASLAVPMLLAAPAPSPFRFDAPPGPAFSEVEKQSQRDKGVSVAPMVRKAFETGAASVTIPPGDYRFGKEAWGEDGPIYPLEFRGMKRDEAHPFRIIAQGVTFWFDLPPDQAPQAHFALGFVDCSHLTLEGVTLDRDPRGCMEGRITRIDEANRRIGIQATEGTLVPTRFSGGLEQRIIPFNADGSFCAALYALQNQPGQLKYRDVTPGPEPGHYWVNFEENSELLKTNQDPAWFRAYGDAGTLQTGDGLCLVYSTTLAISVRDCASLSFIGVQNHITKGGARELGGVGGHLWKDCYFGPRPGTCHWQGGEGILTGCMERGCTYDGLTMIHTTDDIIDIHGFWGYVEKAAGNTVTIQSDHQMPAQAGDQLNFFDRQTGEPLGMALVESVDRQTLTLSRDAAPFAAAIAENPRRQSNGWVIRNSVFSDCYQRLLVQGGNGGTLRDCHFSRVGSGVELHSNFFTNNEGGICRGISILDNTFEDVAVHPEGIAIRAGFQSLNHKARTPLLSGLAVRGNTFVNSGKHAIEFSLTMASDISANTFRDSGRLRELAGKPPPPNGPQPVQLVDCLNITLRGNRILPAARPFFAATSTGSPLANATGASANIVCEP